MKKLFAIAAMAVLILSCSDDETAQNEESDFFPLTEGSLWVYKRYDVSASGVETAFRQTDSARVVGYQEFNGIQYSRVNHKVYSNLGYLNEERDEFMRIDDNGHLINQNGLVIHPGNDTEYQYIRPEGSGTMIYQLADALNVTLAGQSYTMKPFDGYYTPGADVNHPPGLGERIGYTPGVGIVLRRCRYVGSTAYFEDRLEYWEVE